jgi:hypothetical protein
MGDDREKVAVSAMLVRSRPESSSRGDRGRPATFISMSRHFSATLIVTDVEILGR